MQHLSQVKASLFLYLEARSGYRMQDMAPTMLGAFLDPGKGVWFRVFAPLARRVEALILGPPVRRVDLQPVGRGYFEGVAPEIGAGARYFYCLDGGEPTPDPASRLQPEGVSGPSEVVDAAGFDWGADHTPRLDSAEMVVYELHTGAFTPEGTLDAVIPRLAELKALGVDAVELMPVSAFPGRRNWGYDGVFPYAVHAGYGGPRALQRLVRAAHRAGLAVLLDVVYNHVGPEGAVQHRFFPCTEGSAFTPWGRSVNMDGPHSHGIRRYFLDNALQWLEDFHLDGLRLDAVQEIRDNSAIHFLEQLSREVRELSSRTGREFALIAESSRNDPRLVWPARMGGFGLDAMWGFDFHHALHALLTGERAGYFADFGATSDLALALEQGFTLTGQYSHFYQTTWGRPPLHPDGSPVGPHCFMRYSQSHDEAGNRPGGRRLSRITDFEGLKLAAFAALMAPGPAMLFMGEEYGEKYPFHFFVDFDSKKLNAVVRRGRVREMRELGFHGRNRDPSCEAAFRESVLGWDARNRGRGRVLLEFYKILIGLRRALAKIGAGARAGCRAEALDAGLVRLSRPGRGEACVTGLMHCSTEPARIPKAQALEGDGWRLLLDSASAQWGGPGLEAPEAGMLHLPPRSARLYVRGDAAEALYNRGECLP